MGNAKKRRYLLASIVFFLFGNPQRGPGDRLNFLAQKKNQKQNQKQKTNDQNNQGNPGAASDTRG